MSALTSATTVASSAPDSCVVFGPRPSVTRFQVYLYVADGRVSGLAGGCYYLDPATHELVATAPGVRLAEDIHLEANQPTFLGSAFSLFLVAQRRAIEPLYGRRSRDFCLLEAGLMAQLLDTAATDGELGLCHLGLIRPTAPLRAALRLDDGHEILHGLVGGLRPTGSLAEAPDEPRAAGSPGQSLPVRLRAYLAESLPHYMVPATVTELDALPLNANGKVDRGRLASSVAAPRPSVYRAASSDLERAIQAVVERVLGRDRVGVTDSFFDLGATSVTVVEVHRELRTALGRDLPLLSLFEHPDVRALAASLEGAAVPTESAATGANRAQLRRAAARRTDRGRRTPPSPGADTP